MTSYLALKPLLKNDGAVDYEALVNGGDIFPEVRPEADFMLLRIGAAQHPRRDL